MHTPILTCCLTLALMAIQPAMAVPVKIRSGEHGDHTRLVLPIRADATWRLDRTATGYTLELPGHDEGYDTSQVFDRIPRSRLERLRQDGGKLHLDLACNCQVIGFRHQDIFLVMDIRNAPLAAASAGKDPAPPTPTRPDAPSRTPQNWNVPLFMGPREIVLDRHLSHGLTADALNPPAAETSPGSAPTLLAQGISIHAPSVQVSLHEEDATHPRPATTGRTCPETDILDPATWGDMRQGPAATGHLTGLLLDERDRPKAETFLALARAQLQLGMGAETRSLTDSWQEALPDKDMIALIARQIDEPSLALPQFAGLDSCSGPIAMWASLAGHHSPDTDGMAILRTFSALPPWLQDHFAPQLIEHHQRHDDQMTATGIEDQLRQTHLRNSEIRSWITAREALDTNSGEQTRAAMETLIKRDGPAALHALKDLAGNLIRHGQAPTSDQIDLIETAAISHRSTPDGPKILQAALHLRILSGRARSALDEAAADLPDELGALWSRIAEHARADELIEAAVTPPAGSMRNLPDATRLAVARRLLREGFFEMAEFWLEPVIDAQADMMRAEAALQGRDGRRALRYLAGQGGEDAARIRASALELTGDMPAAAAAWNEAGESARGEIAAFLSREWDHATFSPIRASLTDMQAHLQMPPPTDEPASLSGAQALLTRSQTSRSRIQALRAEFPIPRPIADE